MGGLIGCIVGSLVGLLEGISRDSETFVLSPLHLRKIGPLIQKLSLAFFGLGANRGVGLGRKQPGRLLLFRFGRFGCFFGRHLLSSIRYTSFLILSVSAPRETCLKALDSVLRYLECMYFTRLWLYVFNSLERSFSGTRGREIKWALLFSIKTRTFTVSAISKCKQ